MRSYLREQHGLTTDADRRGHVPDVGQVRAWRQLPDSAGYLWRHLATHLTAAGHAGELRALAEDLRWAQAKLGSARPRSTPTSPSPTGLRYDRTVRIWDPTTGATRTIPTDTVTGVAINPDGTWLATTSNDQTVRIWNPTTGANLATMRVSGSLNTVAWSPMLRPCSSRAHPTSTGSTSH